MNPDPQLSGVIERLHNASWVKLPLRDHVDHKETDWLCVARPRDQGVELGFTKEGIWTANVQRSAVKLLRPSDFVFLLPLLEGSNAELELKLQLGLVDLGMDPQLVGTFPLNELLAYALTTQSKHWVSLALKWMEQIVDPTEVLNALVCDLSIDGPTQAIRHQAKRILKRIDNPRSL